MSPITPFMWAQAVVTLALVPAIVLGAAGDPRWIEGWIFCAWYVLGSAYVLWWLYRYNVDLLVERFRGANAKGQTARDKIILPIMVLGFFAWIAIMPLDARRFGWTTWPWPVSLVGVAMLAGASHFLFRAFADNTFLSPVVRVQGERHHRVVDTGVYAIVRHPMYAGALLLIVATPLLLGSWWGLAMVPLLVVLLGTRAVMEERTLMAELPG